MPDPTTRFVSKANAIAIVQGLKEVYTNQNAIAKFKVGATTYTADEVQDLIELVAGTNVQLAIDGNEITISATDTTYSGAVASTSGVGGTDGLLTAADKEKLDGIATGAEVNQNAFASIGVGAGSVVADAKTDSVTFTAGDNVTITASGDAITFAAADTTYTLVQDSNDGHSFTFTPSNGQPVTITIPDADTTYSDVVADSTGVADSGLMTSSDKAKLDGIEDGAEVNIIEAVKVNGTSLTPDGNRAVNVTVTTGEANGTIKVNGSAVPVYGLGTAAYVGTESSVADDGDVPTGAAVKAFVEAKISTVYKPAGSVAFANLPILGGTVLGNVYNLTNAFTTTSDFVEGSGKSYPAGTNVVVVDTGTDSSHDYKFDVLPGFVDLTPYQEKSDLGGLTSAEVAEILAEA